MFGHTFYHGSIRKYIILFGTLFNQIYIRRFDAAGNMVKLIKIPITYGPKDKVIARVQQDPNLNKPFSVVLPYMSFEMIDVQYDSSRKLNTVGQMVHLNDTNKNLADYNYNPVPYNFTFELNIMVKNAEDGSKILEQILPFFTPDWTAAIKIIDDPLIVVDIPTILGDVKSADSWEGDFLTRRVLTWTLRFTMKGYLFGPMRKSKIIKQAMVDLGFKMNAEDTLTDMRVYETITVKPGLTANGQPTSNAEATVPYSEISWEDDFGYVETIEYFPSGKDKT